MNKGQQAFSASRFALLTPEEMYKADKMAVAAGVASTKLMEEAGRQVFAHAAAMAGQGERFIVLCGPGNNGGDGYVAARLLREAHFEVVVASFFPVAKLKGDAKWAFEGWGGEVLQHLPELRKGDIVIDALFGAGLSKEVSGEALLWVRAVNASQARALSVDLPSGASGETGAILGEAIKADVTVSFYRAKPGHYLYPARGYVGKLYIENIGIEEEVLKGIQPKLFLNHPDLWLDDYPLIGSDGHKYKRGHLGVISGEMYKTGAARLAAMAGLRMGAGLVTLHCPHDALGVAACQLTAVMLRDIEAKGAWKVTLDDGRNNAFVIGPGGGVNATTAKYVADALKADKHLVLDADALTSFEHKPEKFLSLIGKSKGNMVLTPHDGEFARLFPDLVKTTSKVERARAAARLSGAIVVLKGADSVIAAPDGRAFINAGNAPYLATAGTGDVLSGMIGGLLAQGMKGFEAAAAAVYLHAKAGEALGIGMIAEDIEKALPKILRQHIIKE